MTIRNFIIRNGEAVEFESLTKEEQKEISVRLNEIAAEEIGYKRTAQAVERRTSHESVHKAKTTCDIAKDNRLERSNHVGKKRIRDAVHCVWVRCGNYAE